MTDKTKKILYLYEQAKKTKEISGTPPLAFIGNGTTLKNYRIYGNTVNGESVGDRTDNVIRDYIVIQTQTQYANVLLVDVEFTPNTTYSFTCLLNDSRLRLYFNENLLNTISYVKDDVVLKVVVKTLSELPDSQKINGKWLMLKNSITEPVVPKLSNVMMTKGSEIPEIYEPYGYRVPVTVTNGTNTQTTNIYLTEQIKIVGNESEYIDFMEQKQHFADGTSTSVDVTLPALPTLSGTNTLSVGTEVQPSRIQLKGKIAIGGNEND